MKGARSTLWLGLLAVLGALCVSPVHAQGKRPSEPSVAQVVRMAQKAAQQSSPERTQALVRRARLAGLVPTLKLGAERGLQQDLSASSAGDTERTNASLGDDLSVDASLTFELPRLVFAPEEVRLLSVDRWLVQDRKKLLEEVVRLYFQRRRLLAERARAPAPDPELDLAIDETQALLDAFTDGAFTRALAAPSTETAHDR
jgi:hypothetical protein